MILLPLLERGCATTHPLYSNTVYADFIYPKTPVLPSINNMEYPSIMLMMPIVSPILSMSFCWTRPVEYAMALGGVEMGKHMAVEADNAIPIIIVRVPPMAVRLSPMPAHTTARMGTRSAAVAVFEIKLLRK